MLGSLQLDPVQEFWTEERCYITEYYNQEDDPQVSLALARVAVGVTTQLHSLTGVTERYLLVQGSGELEIADHRRAVTVGDQVVVPANTAQRITNTGDNDLLFWCVCTPRFTPDCYVNLENQPE